HAAARRRRRVPRPSPRRAAAGLALLAVLGGLGWFGWHWWQVGRFVETTDDAYVGGNVTTISARVPGFVARILVADNQLVQAGQPVIELDRADYLARRAAAEALVRSRQAALATLAARQEMQRATIRQAEATLAARAAAAAFAAEDAARYRSLARSAAGSVQAAQRAAAGDRQAAAAVQAADAALQAARQQSAVLGAETNQAHAALAEAQAKRATARLDLGYTRLTAPVTGYVGDRAAQVGAYVTAGTALLSIVPAHGLWVDANFKEDEIARMRPGQAATVTTDVLPGHPYAGRVLSLAPATGAVFSVIPPQNATGNFTRIVQRVPVRIALTGAAAGLARLRPGLSATVSVDTKPAR
ncbi:MAG: HlyD family secretion protein, partial [Rhodospirillales bacterium]|nr:HlyD family secretion protein [Rhodospirillales bacterium]